MSPAAAAVADPVAAASPRVVPENYNPRHDPDFEATWLTYLVMHAGRWCRASDVYAPRDEYQRAVLRQLSHEVVHAAQRLGLVIEADPRRGYRVVGHAGLPRYLHLHERASDVMSGEAPGQLTLAECVVVE